MDDRIRTSHIGSLPRSIEVLEHLRDAGTGELPSDLVEDAIGDVIAKQAEIGLDIANNGELGRTGFHIHVLDRLTGFEGEGVAPFWGDVREFPDLAAAEFDYPDADPETGAPRRPAVTPRGSSRFRTGASARSRGRAQWRRLRGPNSNRSSREHDSRPTGSPDP